MHFNIGTDTEGTVPNASLICRRKTWFSILFRFPTTAGGLEPYFRSISGPLRPVRRFKTDLQNIPNVANTLSS